jgi:hypothetical protein
MLNVDLFSYYPNLNNNNKFFASYYPNLNANLCIIKMYTNL